MKKGYSSKNYSMRGLEDATEEGKEKRYFPKKRVVHGHYARGSRGKVFTKPPLKMILKSW